jgi:hypothetical protein
MARKKGWLQAQAEGQRLPRATARLSEFAKLIVAAGNLAGNRKWLASQLMRCLQARPCHFAT